MGYRRIHVRVPLNGVATLSSSSNPTIKARSIDISQGGAAITAFSGEISNAEYQIEILTEAGQRIEIFAQLVRVDDPIAGFQTLQMDQKSQEIIEKLVLEYQRTLELIIHMDRFNLLQVMNEEGNEIEITFEKDSDVSEE
jgi:c-di-GMP-binding flagellar brake protein YcgR